MSDDARQIADELRQTGLAQLRQDVIDILSTPAGVRFWLYVREDLCGLRELSPSDPHLQAMFEGRRSVGLALDRMLSDFELVEQVRAVAEEAAKRAVEVTTYRIAEAKAKRAEAKNAPRERVYRPD